MSTGRLPISTIASARSPLVDFGPVSTPIRRLATALAALVLTACHATAEPVSRLSEPGLGDLDHLEKIAEKRRLTAAFLIVDGVYNTELTAPFDVLEHTLYHVDGDLGVEVLTVSPDGAAVTTAEGLRILPDHSFESAPPIDILIVPSAENSRGSDLANRGMIDWVRATGDRASAVMSLCWGAFVLAEAALLDGASATTFPSDYDSFSKRFPDIDLRINVSFVHDGKALTSQGGAKSFDAAMFLVDRLYGEEVATGIGKGLILPWPAPDGTMPYLSSP